MKQYLLLLVGLMILAPYGQADAKAVKLGRGNTYSVAADAKLNTGKTEIAKPQCDSSCTTCDNATGKCLGCPSGKRPSGNRCVDNCYNVVCKSGYTTEVSGNGCCCVATSCPSGQRLENGKCVANCTGVTCKSGYKAVSNSTGCCCEADTPTCSAAQVYHPTLKKCVAAVCPANCADMCSKGYCTSCKTGYTLGSDGMCKQIAITCPANCSTCSSSSTCTKCSSGYYLSSGKCVSCPLNATCSGTSSFSCKSGYERYNNTCRTSSCDGISSTPKWCQDGYTRVVGKGCCPPGVDPNRVGACLQCAVREPALAVDCGNCNCGSGYTVVQNGMTCSCEWDGVTFPAKAAKVCF